MSCDLQICHVTYQCYVTSMFLYFSMVMDATRMMRTVMQKRVKATILYATETGRSRNYANIVKDMFDRSFNCSLYDMDEYNRANLENEQLLLVVTSTFGSGDPPANGEVSKSVNEINDG